MKPKYVEIEEKIFQWISGPSIKWLEFKDKHVIAKLSQISGDSRNVNDDTNGNSYAQFDASKGCYSRFKNRYDFFQRKTVLERTILYDAPEQRNKFILRVQDLICRLKIYPINIISLDQVSRFFELSMLVRWPREDIKEKGWRKGAHRIKCFLYIFKYKVMEKC